MSKNIGIDLGTANVLINIQGEGIVLNEPSVVAVNKKTNKVVAVGSEAYQMVGRTPENIKAIRPLRDGVIADFDITEQMLSYFVKKLNVKGFTSKPNLMICCPTNTTDIERKAIRQVAEKIGGGQVFLELEPKVAAIGAGLDIFQPFGHMIIDIGGGTSDIAFLSLGDLVASRSLKIAGDRLNQGIVNFVKKEYNLQIGERTAEKAKIKVGTVSNRNDKIDVRGRDCVSGLPRTITLTSEKIKPVMVELMMNVVNASKEVLSKVPPELSADIIDNGVMLTGGGSMIDGISKLLSDNLNIPVNISKTPLDDVALGTGILLERILGSEKKR